MREYQEWAIFEIGFPKAPLLYVYTEVNAAGQEALEMGYSFLGRNPKGATLRAEPIRTASFIYKPDPFFPIEGKAKSHEIKKERVDHPAHYQTATGMEVIDVIEAFGLGFNLGNAIKYILRAGKKGEFNVDLDKAIWYLTRERDTYLKNIKIGDTKETSRFEFSAAPFRSSKNGTSDGEPHS